MATSPLARHRSDRGVSPVIGTVLLVAILVTLAGVFGAIAMGFGENLATPTPDHAVFEADYAADGADNGGLAYVTIEHDTGERTDGEELYIKDSDGNTVAWMDVWTGNKWVEAGEYVHIDGKGSDCALNEISEGEVYRLVQRHDGGSTTILNEVVIEEPPANPGMGPYTC